MNASEIVKRFKNELKDKKELYIYGCNFGQGEKGRQAVQFLEDHLNINLNASTNLTGKNGDWNLEIGNGRNGLKLPNFKGNLQLDNTHYLNPIVFGAYTNGTITEEYIYLSTPSTTDITVQMNYALGIGSPRVSVTNLTTNISSTVTTGTLTFKNSTPIRIQFLNTTGNTVVSPGTSPITIPLNNAGVTIPGTTQGLIFKSSVSTNKFYVNYRGRSTAQAGSVLTKGTVALGKEFRWGGSPVEFPTTVPETGNMLSVMATEDNATILKISNIKTGTKFVNGSGGTTLVGPGITVTLTKGQSFILYAPVQNNVLSIQDTG